MRSNFLTAGAALCLLVAGELSAVRACSIPVFRFALDRWAADSYRLEVPENAAREAGWAEFLRNLGDDSQANLSVASAGPGDERVRLLFPDSDQEVWVGETDATPPGRLATSPARQAIIDRLLAGESAVWILLESGRTEEDEQAAERLTKRLAFLETAADLPVIDPADPTSQLGPGPELQVKFSVLRLPVDGRGEDESVLRRMLLGPSPDPDAERAGPIAAVVFGRGRTLGAWPMKDLPDELIDEACLFLLGACSCQVKQLNPGWDLLLSVDWDAALRAVEEAAAPPAAAEAQPAGFEAEMARPETVVATPMPEEDALPAAADAPRSQSRWRPAWFGLAGAGILILLAAMRANHRR